MYCNQLRLAESILPLLQKSYQLAHSQHCWLAINQCASRQLRVLRSIIINVELAPQLRRQAEDLVAGFVSILQFSCDKAESYGTPTEAIRQLEFINP